MKNHLQRRLKVCEPFLWKLLYFCINMTQSIIRFSQMQTKWTQANTSNKYIIIFYSGKCSNIIYLWVANVCKPLGLVFNLKVELESIWFQSMLWQSGLSEFPNLLKNIFTSLSTWHFMNDRFIDKICFLSSTPSCGYGIYLPSF